MCSIDDGANVEVLEKSNDIDGDAF